MARLRDPERGCPWDRDRRGFDRPHTIEEAYEIADAVERGDIDQVRDELGDLLFQVVFQSRIAEEQGLFRFDDVVDAISGKLERRHPHVFGDATIGRPRSRRPPGKSTRPRNARQRTLLRGVLDGVTLGLPALPAPRSSVGARPGRLRLARRGRSRRQGARGGRGVAAGRGRRRRAVREEVGDLLFSVAQLARHLDVDAEGSLRDAGGKFERRFRRIEACLAAEGRHAATRAWPSWRRCGHGQNGRSAEGRARGAAGAVAGCLLRDRRRFAAWIERLARRGGTIDPRELERLRSADADLRRSPQERRLSVPTIVTTKLCRYTHGAPTSRPPSRRQRRHRQRRHRQRQEHAVAEDLPRDGTRCRRHDRPHAAAAYRGAGTRAPDQRGARLRARGPRRLPGALRRSHQPAYAREADDRRAAAARTRKRPAARAL